MKTKNLIGLLIVTMTVLFSCYKTAPTNPDIPIFGADFQWCGQRAESWSNSLGNFDDWTTGRCVAWYFDVAAQYDKFVPGSLVINGVRITSLQNNNITNFFYPGAIVDTIFSHFKKESDLTKPFIIISPGRNSRNDTGRVRQVIDSMILLKHQHGCDKYLITCEYRENPTDSVNSYNGRLADAFNNNSMNLYKTHYIDVTVLFNNVPGETDFERINHFLPKQYTLGGTDGLHPNGVADSIIGYGMAKYVQKCASVPAPNNAKTIAYSNIYYGNIQIPKN